MADLIGCGFQASMRLFIVDNNYVSSKLMVCKIRWVMFTDCFRHRLSSVKDVASFRNFTSQTGGWDNNLKIYAAFSHPRDSLAPSIYVGRTIFR